MAEHPISEKHQALHDHGQDLDKVLSAMPSEEQFIQASEIFQQLCDPTRLRILWLLAHSEQCVNNISLAIVSGFAPFAGFAPGRTDCQPPCGERDLL